MSEPAFSLKATGRSRRRLLVNKVAEGAAMLAAVLAVGALALVVWAVFIRGVGALNLDFFIKGPPQFGQSVEASRRRSPAPCCSSPSPPRSRCRSGC